MKETLTFSINNSGQITAIYSDQLQPLLAHGEALIERASHVEPKGKEWTADLSPVQGPVLGPFTLREEALQAEVSFLEEKLFKP